MVGIDEYEVPAIYAVSTLALSLIIPIVALFRNIIIVKTFWKIGPERFAEITKLLSRILGFLLIVSLVTFFAGACTPRETWVYSQGVEFLTLSILCFLFPLYSEPQLLNRVKFELLLKPCFPT